VIETNLTKSSKLKESGMRTKTWVDYRWKEATNLFTETNKVSDDVEMLWLYNTTAIVSERLAEFSINKAWCKIKEVQLSIDTTKVRDFQWV